MSLIGIPSNTKLTKLYAGSINGFGASNFHSNCDGFYGTLTIVKSSNLNVFGGFTKSLWNSSNAYQSDSDAFIFSLINQYNYPVKLNPIKSVTAVYTSSSYGPTFGNNHDFYIADQSISNTNSRSNLGNSYMLPLNMTAGSTSAQTFLAGSLNFQTIEIEIYSINGLRVFF